LVYLIGYDDSDAPLSLNDRQEAAMAVSIPRRPRGLPSVAQAFVG